MTSLRPFGELRLAGEIPQVTQGPAQGGDLLPNYGNPQRAGPEVILPSSGAERRGASGTNAWGTWASVATATAEDLVLLGAHLARVAAESSALWVRVGVDPTGGTNYSPIGLIGLHSYLSGSGYPSYGGFFRLLPVAIPAGSGVALSGWGKDASIQFQGYLALLPATASWYDPWPNTYIGGGRAGSLTRVPAVPAFTTIASGAAYSEILATAPNDMLLAATETFGATAGEPGQIVEVAIGPAGHEVLFSRAGIPSVRVGNPPSGYQDFARKALILAGERVAARPVGPHSTPIALYLENLT